MKTKFTILTVLIAIIGISAISLTVVSLLYDMSPVFGGQTLNEADVAKQLIVRIKIDGEPKEKVYDSFSRIGFVKSGAVEFLLESLPSKDKKDFYEFLETNLNVANQKLMDVHIDVFTGDGTLIETLNYNRCQVDSYFVFVDDSKGSFRFLEGSSSMEIREVTKFLCTSFEITT